MKLRIRSFTKALMVMCVGPFLACAQVEVTRVEPRIDLSYFQEDDDLPHLTCRVRVKRDKGWEPVKWVIVNLFLNEQTKSGMMGNVTTDIKGGGKYILPKKFKAAWDSLDEYTFTARIKGDSQVLDAEETITIKRGKLQVSTAVVDSLRMVKVSFMTRQSGAWVPIEEVEMKTFIGRSFGKLPFGEESYTTNEDGLVTLQFSEKIPGDSTGRIEIGAWIEDHDDFGTLTSRAQVAWGLPLQANDGLLERRTLWSTRDRAPMWLLLISTGMIGLVWGVIVYLVYLIYVMARSKKEFLR